MVSLINFKIVNEELQEQQQQQISSYRTSNTVNNNNNNSTRPASQLLIKVVKNESQQQQQHQQAQDQQSSSNVTFLSPQLNYQDDENQLESIKESNLQLVPVQHQSNMIQQQQQNLNYSCHSQRENNDNNINKQSNYKQVSILFSPSTPTSFHALPEPVQTIQIPVVNEAPNFVVTWRNLKFAIQSKWHERVVNSSSSSVTSTDQQVVQHNTLQADRSASKVVLDNLDGSFRSGELTAILGPSGAGKTTLLDCLTGHRKTGLSGSIRISSSSMMHNGYDETRGNNKCHNQHNYHHHLNNNIRHHSNNHKGCQFNKNGKLFADTLDNNTKNSQQDHSYSNNQQINNGDNLKVSIIPQNDHLMGHLTVYETLNYASKMKNCFDKQFDHKLNIKRVAQQLGLMSCLGTRINKLSGGQYKRVSIAQELLSSPDILILDEPTSGLDAMTCYQTVQVLKKLTDDRQISGQNQIAVILTIHQPNSDVFQQFNHVYVVAQGGKCIYEGPPSSIESVINQVGIRLPSSYYNPATMIVEIAAGKFGLDAIEKLNSIQKKQYDFNMADEQNSTGDSAVDCPSLSSQDEDDDEDEEGKVEEAENQNTIINNNTKTATITTSATSNQTQAMTLVASGMRQQHIRQEVVASTLRQQQQQDDNNNCRPISEINNNLSGAKQLPLLTVVSVTNGDSTKVGGLVNKGFVMEGEDGNSNSCKDVTGDVIVVVQSSEGEEGKADKSILNGKNNDADSLDKIKLTTPTTIIKMMMSNSVEGSADVSLGECNNEIRMRKKRRRTRKRSNEQQQQPQQQQQQQQQEQQQQVSLNSDLSSNPQCDDDDDDDVGDTSKSHIRCTSRSARTGTGGGAASGKQQKENVGCGCGGSGNGGNNNPSRQEKRLKLNSLKADQKFPFWRHTYLHFHRSWLSIIRDPMLCSMQLALHIIVPVMVSLVYGTDVGKPNACPRAGPMDIMAYALEPTDTSLQLQEDFRRTLENIGYIFFKLYGIIFAAMTVTVLTFPLDMHVLVKEFRNGWYGLSSYFLGRTLADIPFQLTLPLLAMSLSYYATGQPYSYMQWRFLSITAILILSSLIAQSQGLLFGAILMDRMKAAVFVAPAATTPIILFAGFLVRTQSIPRYLRPLSNLSYLRYAIEACLISRYGFNQCECDPAIFNQTVPELPPIARSMLDYWLSSFKATSAEQTSSSSLIEGNSTAFDLLNETLTTTTTLSPATSGNPDLFSKLIDSLAKANSFGRNITSCDQVVPYPMIDYDLKDSQLINCFAILLFMLVFTRLLTFFIVCFKVKRKV